MTNTKSETLKVTEINAATGEVIVRDLTDDELEQRKLDAAGEKASKAQADAKLAARESALAKLAALGLTAEEIGAL
jgi:DNA-binding NarL/FixJ family response regulator